ncbi:MHS family proline/betaine transporter-like MFS transporter [Spinactinospora alkalitolerans]|uniref:Putative proline/betaine transporter n=1 Tax=Spinactinospora alkalitolerans TaxID=687207 RepID=A0A852TZ16_9ACTN|nr:MFS transporter [Spinactinospora alkalitolerans]NYE48033.1 MHS family proline/betaine transporter-like MFS transporter [Spinactinospora alkalitolerans]
MTGTSSSASAENQRSATLRRVVAASFIGNFVEWFDYAVYGYLAATISVVFFPQSSPTAGLLATFGIFALSFVIRPVGGIVWGHFGDRIGRRTALSLSILIMSAATFVIALLPGYEQIGLMAPVLLLAVRMVQGFSAAGEYAGAAAFLYEYAPRHRRGVYAGVVPASTATGLLLGSLLVTALTAVLSTDQMASWGWRLPFLLAAPLGLIGRYIRVKLEDTPEFRALGQAEPPAHAPMTETLRDNRRAIVVAFGATCLNAVGFYTLLTYMPTYLSTELGVEATTSFLSTTVALCGYIASVFAMSRLSDRVGRPAMLAAAGALFAVFSVPAFLLLGVTGVVGMALIQLGLGVLLSMNDGTLPSYLCDLFPTRVRYSGFAFSFNTANALFGGTAPFMATFLIHISGSSIAPAWYLAAAGAVGVVCMPAAHRIFHSLLPQERRG